MASAVATMAATASSSASKSRRCVASPCASEGIAVRKSWMSGEHGAELESRCNRGRALLQCNLNALRDRISVVKNTQKITDAMKLVAAARVRRAQEAVLNGRPFSETLVRVLYCVNERIQGEDVDSPLIKVRPVKKVALVVVTGDRGLCGGYNNFLIKKAEERARQLRDSASVDVMLITVGRKGNEYFGKRTEIPLHKMFEKNSQPTAADAQAITDELFALFVSETVDKVEIIYSKFVSLIRTDPIIQTLLPLSPQGQVCDINGNCVDANEDEMFRLSTNEGKLTVERERFTMEVKPFSSLMIFEPDPTQLLDALYPLYLNSQVLRALQEALASELASRMNAMTKASDNAAELTKTLSVQYNRMRQAKVTTEILEIVAGASAV